MPTKRVVRKAAAGPTKKVAPRPPVDDDDDYEAEASNGDAPKGKRAKPEAHEGEIRAGWGAAQETIDSTSSFAQAFKVTTDSQIIKFLSASPYANFRRHWVDRIGIGRRPYTCLESVGSSCPLCDVGDKPGAVSAFNIALLSDDGVATVKSWDAGVKITQQLKTYHNDPKIGPLDKRMLYFVVSKSESTKRQQVTTMINPVRERDLEEDWATPPLDDEQLAKLVANAYKADILEIPRRSEVEEIALELAGEDSDEAKPWGG